MIVSRLKPTSCMAGQIIWQHYIEYIMKNCIHSIEGNFINSPSRSILFSAVFYYESFLPLNKLEIGIYLYN